MTDVIAAARRVATDVLAPAAEETDASGVIAQANLDALAEAGLYGLGVGDEPFVDVCLAVEILAEACLTTAFLLSQHIGQLRIVASAAPAALQAQWLEPMRRGERRVGAAFTGAAMAGPALLHATPDGAGWRLDGWTPWISGWGHIDAMHAAGRAPDGRVVWALLDARIGDGLAVKPLQLLAIDASATVQATFDGVAMAADRVTQITPEPTGGVVPAATRMHAALSLGVASRCAALLESERLRIEVDGMRARLDDALEDADALALARAAVGELTIRAASALLVRGGARGAIAAGAAQRLVREAHLLSIFGLRAPIKAALLRQLGA